MLAFVFHKFWGTLEGPYLSLRFTQEFWGPLATETLVMVFVTLRADICGMSDIWHSYLSLSSRLPSYHICAQLDGLLKPGHKAEMFTTGLELRFQIPSVLLNVLNYTYHQDWTVPVTGHGKWIWHRIKSISMRLPQTDQKSSNITHTRNVRWESRASCPASVWT